MKPTPSKILVAIVDDHPMVLHGLGAVLTNYEHIQVEGVYKNGKEVQEGLTHAVPDVLLLDIQLPDIPGDELAPELLEKYPNVKILVLTNFDSALYATKMEWIGVHGYLLKSADEAILIEAIETVYAGGHYIQKEIRDNIDRNPLRSKKILAAKTSLTPREKEVLQLITDGLTDEKISEALFLSLNTIKHYRMTLLLKMDANNTASLVSKALKLGLVR